MDRGDEILLLAGSAEARRVAEGLLQRGLRVRALLSELPRGSDPMPVPFTLTDFRTESALQSHVTGARAVLDASHGFDGLMTQTGYRVACRLGLPFLTLRRPAWSLSESPLWRGASTVLEAMAMVPQGARVLAATGWESLQDMAGFPGERLWLRQTLPHDRAAPFDFVELAFGDPPFTVESEKALFRELSLDLLICRNLGGQPSRPKLEAAKALALPVILIDRPPLPEGVAQVPDVAQALAWVESL